MEQRLAKRVLPAVCRPIVAADVPGRLARLNWIDFSDARTFDAALASLEQALLTDIKWIREHTRLGEVARRWHLSDQPRHELLHGPAVDAAEQWLRYRPSTAPRPTDTITSFIAESRQEERRAARRRRLMRAALVGLGLSVITVTGLAYAGYLDATYLEGRLNSVLNQWRDSDLKSGDAARDCWSTACPEMVLLPTGTFMMGSPEGEVDRVRDEGPQH